MAIKTKLPGKPANIISVEHAIEKLKKLQSSGVKMVALDSQNECIWGCEKDKVGFWIPTWQILWE